MKHSFWPLIVISGIPLIMYPWVLFAHLMYFLAEGSTDQVGIVPWLAWHTFLWGTTLYPVVYFACGAMGWERANWGSAKSTVFYSLAPLLYLFFLVGLFALLDSQLLT
ncbi:MAG: hypothetical protein WD738_05125 [Pirellulales bacterium]